MHTEAHAFQPRDLIGGHLALDLVNTVTARDSTPRDWLADYASLLDWAGLTGRMDGQALAGLERAAARNPEAAQAALMRCKALRGALHAILRHLAAGKPPTERSLATLDAMRLAASARARLVAAKGGVTLQPVPALAGLDYVADVVLHEALALLENPPRERLRVCAGQDCGWLFHDTSKAGRRRWCDMAVCGTVQKTRRQRGAALAVAAWLLGAAWGGLPLDASAAAPVRWTPAAVSSPAYEASPAFSPDGAEMVFMRADPGFSTYTLLRSRCSPQGWSRPEAAPFALPGKADDGDPFITSDGRRLYFISTRSAPDKPGKDFDIWYVERQGMDAWGAPVRLPAPVNSPHAELMPRVLDDGRIYFGSDRPGGLGGNDVYVASPLPEGGWRVDNLGPEVNSAANEFEVEVSRDARALVLVSDRDRRSHLYRFSRDKTGAWRSLGPVQARLDVFQVGPLLSPKGDRLLFAQSDRTGSGELFLADLGPEPDRSWPPACPTAGQK